MSVRKTLAVLMGSGLLLGTAQLPAAPTATMLADTCAGCHGTDGASTGPATPNIAGMSETYFTDTMLAFKSGDRGSTVMGRIAKGYSEEEMKLMAGYFAKQPMAITQQTTDAAKVTVGEKLYSKNCSKCHDENGTLADDDAGILASQWLPYLRYSMEDFKAGTTDMPKKMKKKVDKLSDAEIEGLLQFFASQQ
ncbi:MAG: c-type cytochrome [Pseudomonadota bacterium]|nr:c-type cytochrome [Pseudomonadota bacterium]